MKSNLIFVKFHGRLQNSDFVVVLVLHLLKNSDFDDEHEDEDEKSQIKSHASAPAIAGLHVYLKI